MSIKNRKGFLVEEINLQEVSAYIVKLPAYKTVVKKIDSIRKKIKKCTKKDIKIKLRSVLKQLIEKKKRVIETAFYTKYPTQTKITRTIINTTKKLRKRKK